MRLSFGVLFIAVTVTGCLLAQPAAPIKLSLHDAEALALKNHPQVLAAQHELSAMNQRMTEVRSAYYPHSTVTLPARRAITAGVSARAS